MLLPLSLCVIYTSEYLFFSFNTLLEPGFRDCCWGSESPKSLGAERSSTGIWNVHPLLSFIIFHQKFAFILSFLLDFLLFLLPLLLIPISYPHDNFSPSTFPSYPCLFIFFIYHPLTFPKNIYMRSLFYHLHKKKKKMQFVIWYDDIYFFSILHI